MNNVDRFFQRSHYNIIRVLLSLSGTWPFHTVVRRYVIYFAIALVLGSGYVFEIMGIAEIWRDTFALVDSVPLLFLGIVGYSKVICAIYTLPKIKILLIKMQKYCLSPKSDEEYKIQQSHALYGRNLGIAYTIEHCCGLFAALRFRLEHAFELENNDSILTCTTTSKKNKSYSNVVYSIRRHAEAIQFVTIMESTYSIPLFIHMGCTMLVLSVLGYQVLTNMGNLNLVLHHSSYLNGLLINLFFENWQGQKIIDSSEKVFDSAYNTEWYNMPIMARKLLIMIMMNSKKPLIVSGGHRFIVMSYVTFNAILRMSMSYFMLLRSV
ncbi:odorant receptor Or2-like isoform X2 [Linepithema humile]|uniref:odorant receptor Or2-like isoform X2 n=1 Tax=Linepithema humile TaxID=83485 RepID=UPI00351F798E